MNFTLMACVTLLLVSACSDPFDTPNDIHDRLVPRIAKDLIETGSSGLLRNQPFDYSGILTPREEIRYQHGAPEMNGDTGITFYRGNNPEPILMVGLMLYMDKKSYSFYAHRLREKPAPSSLDTK